ncbi:MAG: DNA alkylation repair protein [Bacteroidales bacterium]|jgi:3-methyladenine DNA glycosylase AlkD|nr:DNA alkylation repair protein [Bacteroidales bacterium]
MSNQSSKDVRQIWYEALFTELYLNKNELIAVQMSAYMRNKFPFLGIQKTKLKEIQKPFIKEMKKNPVDWSFVDACWKNNYREIQYVALSYLRNNVQKLTDKDLPKLKKLAISKSWWDTIDAIDKIVGSIISRYPEYEKTIIEWSVSNNIWLRRIAIDHQLLKKDKTNTALLEKIIVNNLGSKEFFINKAIGWSLRDYSKTNPQWVNEFINKYGDRMNSLSVREASKYL